MENFEPCGLNGIYVHICKYILYICVYIIYMYTHYI